MRIAHVLSIGLIAFTANTVVASEEHDTLIKSQAESLLGVRRLALMTAVEQGDTEDVRKYLAPSLEGLAKLDPNFHRLSDEKTPLHIAAERGYADVVKVLLAAGANAQISDNRLLLPLFYAHAHNHKDVHAILWMAMTLAKSKL